MHLQERPHQLMDVEVGPDGTVWTIQEVQGGGYAILSFDGDDWTRHRDALDEAGVEVAPDGTVWSAWDASDLDDVQIIGYLDGDRWQPVGNLRDPDELLISGTGDIWAAAGMNTKSWVSKLYRLNEDRWQDADRYVHQVAVGPDGTVWTNVGLVRPPVLSRFDGTEWQDWPLGDSPSKPMGRFS